MAWLLNKMRENALQAERLLTNNRLKMLVYK